MSERTFKEIPDFDSEDEEREFWASNDSTEFVDWQGAKRRKFPNLPSSTAIGPHVMPMTLFRQMLAAGFRPKTEIVSLEVYLDDPSGDDQIVPLPDLADVKLESWLYLRYEIERGQKKGTATGYVQLLYDSGGQLVEVGGLDGITSSLESEFVAAATDALSAAIQYCRAAMHD